MPESPHVTVRIDLEKIARNVQEIRRGCGVSVLGVVKADAYGVGIEKVAEAIGSLVDRFCVFSLEEAIEADLWKRTGKGAMTFGPPSSMNPQDYLEQHVRPAVSTVEQARALRKADPILCVDTGMKRFACAREGVDEVLKAGGCREAFTHAIRVEQARELKQMLGGRGLRLHAAASALLEEPEARLDAVRPGLAMYEGAVRVSTAIVEVHDSPAAAGYTGFSAGRVGVILAGYSQGLRAGPCVVGGRMSRILEVGMQSSFVEITNEERVGDEVVLLGEGLTAREIGLSRQCSPQEVILRLSGAGKKVY